MLECVIFYYLPNVHLFDTIVDIGWSPPVALLGVLVWAAAGSGSGWRLSVGCSELRPALTTHMSSQWFLV